MKTIFFTLVSVLMIVLSHAQYTVTKIKGRVKGGQGNYIKPGSIINKTDVLIFSSRNDNLWVIIPGEGEKIITPSAQAQAIPGGFQQVLGDAVFADPKVVSLRAGVSIIEKLPAAIRSENDIADKIVVEEENKFLFDQADYPQNGTGEFFLQIDMPSKQPLRRRLRVTGDTLIIYYEDFLTETNNPGNRYLLGYHIINKKASRLVTQVKPYFDRTNEMEGIIANTVSAYKKENMPQDSLVIKAYNNVYRSSGKPNGILFSSMFTKYWAGNIDDTLKIEPKGKGNKTDDADTSSIPVLSNLISTSRDKLPDNFSLRQYAPPPGDQKTYSTCAAWSTAYAARTISYAISHNYTYLEDSDKIKSNTFSPAYVYNNIVHGGDCYSGISLHMALRFIADSGVITKGAGQFTCGEAYMPTDINRARDYRLKGYELVTDKKYNEAQTVDRLKALLVAKHPLVFGMITPASFDSVGKSGIWQPNDAEYKNMDSIIKKLAPVHDGHAMCLVGYDDSIADGAFEIMNSWGPLVARKGFYWITYHDFYLFVRDAYTINDYLPSDGTQTGTPVKKNDTALHYITTAVKIDSAVIVSPPPLLTINTQQVPTDTAAIIALNKPRLKGDMQFLYSKNDGGFGILTLAAKTGDTYYSFGRALHKDDQYGIKLNLSQDAYVYIMGADATSPYWLFPREKTNESPLVNLTNATLTLPGDNIYYTIDSVPGKEHMCVLLSKSPIDVDALYKTLAANTGKLYDAVINSLAGRDVSVEKITNTTLHKIDFDHEATDNSVLAFFIEINHL